MAIGALTSPEVFNLGDPPWHHSASVSTRRSASRSTRNRCTVRETATARITTCSKARS
jgi:hypothetical protein